MFRPDNVHSAERWREVLEPVVERYQAKGVRLRCGAYAAFVRPEVYEYLESRTLVMLCGPLQSHLARRVFRGLVFSRDALEPIPIELRLYKGQYSDNIESEEPNL